MTLTNAELIGLVSNKNLDAEAFNAAKAELIRRIELRETNKDGEVEKLRAELRAAKERISELEAELAACKEDTNGFEAANAQLITDLVALDGEAEKLRAELRAERDRLREEKQEAQTRVSELEAERMNKNIWAKQNRKCAGMIY